MEQNQKNYAVIHTYGYLRSKRHADLLGIYASKDEAEASLPSWKSAREESKAQIERLGITVERHKPYVDKFVVFGYSSDSIKSNDDIVKLFLMTIEDEF